MPFKLRSRASVRRAASVWTGSAPSVAASAVPRLRLRRTLQDCAGGGRGLSVGTARARGWMRGCISTWRQSRSASLSFVRRETSGGTLDALFDAPYTFVKTLNPLAYSSERPKIPSRGLQLSRDKVSCYGLLRTRLPSWDVLYRCCGTTLTFT